MSGLLLLVLGLSMAQALPDDAPATPSPTLDLHTVRPIRATSATAAGLDRPEQSRANATGLPPSASPSSNASLAGQQGLDSTVRVSAATEKMSSLPDLTSPGTTTLSEEATEALASTSSSVQPASSTSTSSHSTEASATPEHSSLAAQKPSDQRALSSGVVALVMAVVFALLVVIVYAGLLLWRRYLEYRYGNRELLVNDLEFDTSDLRHFEL